VISKRRVKASNPRPTKGDNPRCRCHHSRGKGFLRPDLIVAATALERGSQVATFNKRHFALVNGLHIIEPR